MRDPQTQESDPKNSEINLLFMALEDIKDLSEKFMEINERLEDNCTQNQKKITAIGNNTNLWGDDIYMVPLKCFVCYKTGGLPVLRMLVSAGEINIDTMYPNPHMTRDEKTEVLVKELSGTSNLCRRKKEESDFDKEREQLRKMSDVIIEKLRDGASVVGLAPLESIMKEEKKEEG
jgi:hypothetical protein